jgi:outer membrane lipoprotein SlyB
MSPAPVGSEGESTMMRPILRLVVAAALVVPLAACNPPYSGDVVRANQAQVAQSVAFGTITDARPVTVQGGNAPATVTGTIAGGLAGGLLGNEIGGGTGQDIATVVGATAGAAAGNRIAGAATTQQSTEWFVRTDGGQTISVIQAQPAFNIGQRVQIVQSGGVTRLQPAT